MGVSRGLIKRTKTIGIYLSKEEVKILKRQARDRGLSVPAYIRMLVRQYGEREGFDGKQFPSQGKG